jgi:hypothetical protein
VVGAAGGLAALKTPTKALSGVKISQNASPQPTASDRHATVPPDAAWIWVAATIAAATMARAASRTVGFEKITRIFFMGVLSV